MNAEAVSCKLRENILKMLHEMSHKLAFNRLIFTLPCSNFNVWDPDTASLLCCFPGTPIKTMRSKKII